MERVTACIAHLHGSKRVCVDAGSEEGGAAGRSSGWGLIRAETELGANGACVLAAPTACQSAH